MRFAVEHRAHFAVMYRPELYRPDDPAVQRGRARAAEALYGGVAEVAGPDVRAAGLAAWSLVHGFATLWINGALPDDLGTDAAEAARTVARQLFTPR